MMDRALDGKGGTTAIEDGACPSVSVVIPALDEEKALPEVLESLQRQEGAPPFEVILADGGSADRTAAFFSEIAAAWPQPRPASLLVESPRRGRAAQMNAGARAARGDVLLFLHADTLLPPGAIAALGTALRDFAAPGWGALADLRAVSPGCQLNRGKFGVGQQRAVSLLHCCGSQTCTIL